MDLSNVPLSKNISSRFRSYIYHVPRNQASLSEWALPLPILDCLSILVLVHAPSPNINKHLFSHIHAAISKISTQEEDGKREGKEGEGESKKRGQTQTASSCKRKTT